MSNTKLVPPLVCVLLSTLFICPALVRGQDRVFSGPQAGEKTTPFKVIEINASADGKERDPITENKGAPTALVFLHGIERSLVPLLSVIEQYGADHKDRLNTEIVFLTGDRLAGEQRFKAAANSLRLRSRLGISVDGAEGPGNYGLNKECLMTFIVAKENKVTANFALIQPGIADAPKVIGALAQVIGDKGPPTAEALQARRQEQMGGRNRAAMAPGSAPMQREKAAAAPSDKPKEEFPGKPPTDEKLMGLLRQFIRPANDEAAVDRVLKEVEDYVKGDAGLRRQAIDGWTRVLHFGDRYGTAYARKQGQAAMEKWKRQK